MSTSDAPRWMSCRSSRVQVEIVAKSSVVLGDWLWKKDVRRWDQPSSDRVTERVSRQTKKVSVDSRKTNEMKLKQRVS
jgi:hypothetical protein